MKQAACKSKIKMHRCHLEQQKRNITDEDQMIIPAQA